ncbi:MAG: helix-turn-helix domain-containing protein, partial [Bacteroidales bacterium]|nr:helix-turn-helix domain-containing protein [Bacteroidales bacterium]
DFGANELSRESGMSLYRLNHRLNRIKGKTTNQFIRELRLQKALEMLQDGALTISEIAYRTGFSSPSYFISCFHEYFGYPPGKLLKEGFGSREESKPVPEELEPEQTKSTRRTFIFATAAILILAFIIYLGITLFAGDVSNRNRTPETIPEKSVAILPFRNLSDNTSDQYLYDGLMEEIFNNLSKVKELRVISRTSVEQYRNSTKTIPVIGKELDVNYIVEGSGQKVGRSFRIRIQLIEVSTDRHIWGDSYQRVMKNTKRFFRIQSLVAQNIASELKSRLTPAEKQLIDKVPTLSNTAFESYLKANEYQKDYENTRSMSSYQAAANLYNAAIEKDSAFARAYTGLAFLHWKRYYYENYFKEGFLDSCLVLAGKALSYDDKLDEAYFIKGQFYRANGDSEEALKNYDKALEINPNYYAAYEWKSYIFLWVLDDYVKGLENNYKALNLVRGQDRPKILRYMGRIYIDAGFPEKARNCYDEALVLDGRIASWWGNTSWIEFSLGNFEEALKLKKQHERIDSASYLESANLLGYYCVFSDRNEEAYDQAREVVDKYQKAGALNLARSHRVGYAFWNVGKKREAEEYFRQQIRYGEEDIKLSRGQERSKAAQYDLACTFAFLGEKGKAYKYLDEFSKKNTFPLWWVTMIKHEQCFNNIRNEERFSNIVKTIESKHLAEHERVRKWLEEQGML